MLPRLPAALKARLKLALQWEASPQGVSFWLPRPYQQRCTACPACTASLTA